MENLHPITVHFTIALFLSAIAFEVIGWVGKLPSLKSAGKWNLLAATAAAVASVVTGFVAADSAPHNEEIHQVIRVHQTIGLIVLGLVLALFLWRYIGGRKGTPRGLTLYLIVGLIAAVLMTVGGYYGGELVYTYGMGVKPMMEMMNEEHDHASGGDPTPSHHEAETDSVFRMDSGSGNSPHQEADVHPH